MLSFSTLLWMPACDLRSELPFLLLCRFPWEQFLNPKAQILLLNTFPNRSEGLQRDLGPPRAAPLGFASFCRGLDGGSQGRPEFLNTPP